MTNTPIVLTTLNIVKVPATNVSIPHISPASSVTNVTSPLSTSSSAPSLSVDHAVTTTLHSNIIMRQLQNILMLLFRHHPKGVNLTELPLLYQQTFGEMISVTEHFQYLLYTHRAISSNLTTNNVVYTLNTAELSNTLKSFDPFMLKPYVAEHVLKLFSYFPNGIPCIHFEQTLEKLSQFKISDCIPSWISFVTSIPFIFCCNIGGLNMFINTIHFGQIQPIVSDISDISDPSDPFVAPGNVEHVRSPFCEDHCSVFLGGFPHGTRVDDIKRELDNMGFVVVHCSGMKYKKFGFTWVTLASTKKADALIQRSPIKMLGNDIEVRPFINRTKQKNERPKDDVIFHTMIELLLKKKDRNMGLSICEMQPILYRMFSHRVAGSDLVEIVKKNNTILCIKTDNFGQQKIYFNYK